MLILRQPHDRNRLSINAPVQRIPLILLMSLLGTTGFAQEKSAIVHIQERPVAQPQAANGKMGLEALIEQAIAHEPNILRLKRQVDIERSRVKFAAPPRNPEVRLGFSHGSDPALSRPYTEVEEETITQSGNRSSRLNRTESSNGSESRTGTENRSGAGARSQSFNEQRQSSENGNATIRDSERFNETTTRTTRREITPTRRGEIVRTTVEEASNERFRETQTENGSATGRESRNNQFSGTKGSGLDADAFSTRSSENGSRSDSGSSSSRVISESISERSFDRASSDGSDQFSVQFRIFPRNPWEKAAREERAQGAVLLAQFNYDAAVRALENEVRQIYMELQFLRKRVGLSDSKLNFLDQEIAFHRKLFEAGRGGADDLVATQINAINLQKERREAEDILLAGKASLAARVHVEDVERIDLGDPTTERKIDIDRLSLDELLEAALFADDQAGIIALEQRLIRKDMALVEAEKYPWFSLISATYGYEERFNAKYQDNFSIVAGVTLPVFDWFGKEDKTEPQKLEIQALEEQRKAIHERLKYKIMLSLDRLKQSLSSAETFSQDYADLRTRIVAMKTKLADAGGLEANKQMVALERHLVEIDTRALSIGLEYARALLNFESMLGVDLDSLDQ
jgi:outer membrane protein TolC